MPGYALGNTLGPEEHFWSTGRPDIDHALFSNRGAGSPLDPQLYANERSLERRFTTVSKATLMVASWSKQRGGTGVRILAPERSLLSQKKHS